MSTRKASRAASSPHGTRTWLAVVRAYNLCDAAMSARLAELGLRVGEHEVLATLATAPGITQQALAARCFVAKSGVSMLLAQRSLKVQSEVVSAMVAGSSDAELTFVADVMENVSARLEALR